MDTLFRPDIEFERNAREEVGSSVDWKLQHVRFSVFSAEAEFVSDRESLFAAVAGKDADVDEKRGGGKIRRRVAEADLGRWELIEAIGRLDINHLGLRNLDFAAFEGQLSSASIGTLADLNALLSFSTEVLGRTNQITRMAVGGLFFAEMASTEACYQALAGIFPMLPLSYPNCSDFILQVNRPTPEELAPMGMLNRLSTWNSMHVMMQIGGSAAAPVGSNWVQCAFDVNTAGENTQPIDITVARTLVPRMLDHVRAISAGPFPASGG